MKSELRYRTFADVMAACQLGELTGELRLVAWTGTSDVTLSQVHRGPGEDDYDETQVYRSETLETFMIDVAEAMGWKGDIA